MSKDNDRQELIVPVLMNLLSKLDEVCKNNGLRYYLAFGTCLGAVREKGFIPWDKDIDVFMFLDDAKKLVELQPEFGDKYFVQCKKTDPEFYSIFYQLSDSETTCIWREFKDFRFNQGIKLDIYPLYYAPKGRMQLLLKIWTSYLYRILVCERAPLNHSILTKIGTNAILALIKGDKRILMAEKLEKKLSAIRPEESDSLCTYYGAQISYFNAVTYPKEWFQEPSKLEFEGKVFDGPSNPQAFLSKVYGDYMTPIPDADRGDVLSESNVILDTEHSYTHYYEGNMINEYFENHSIHNMN